MNRNGHTNVHQVCLYSHASCASFRLNGRLNRRILQHGYQSVGEFLLARAGLTCRLCAVAGRGVIQ